MPPNVGQGVPLDSEYPKGKDFSFFFFFYITYCMMTCASRHVVTIRTLQCFKPS